MTKKKQTRYTQFLKGSPKNTIISYNQAIKLYENFHGMTLEELVEEALDEQTERVPSHKLKIIDRIEGFQKYLIEEKLEYNTINIHLVKIKRIYRKARVDLPYMESVSPKVTKRKAYISYKDILKKEEIKQAITHMRKPNQAKVVAMAECGLSNEECEHFTTRQFIDETHKYHQCTDDLEALRWLAKPTNPIVWVHLLIRQKTKKPYYAIISPEAVNFIAQAKLYEYELPSNKKRIPEKLFSYSKTVINKECKKVNDRLGLGYAGRKHIVETSDDDGLIKLRKHLFRNFEMISDVKYDIIKKEDYVYIKTEPSVEVEYYLGGEARLRPHNFRRFHATHLGGGILNYQEEAHITNAEIDEMQGRGKTATQDTYIKTNPLRQKLLFAKVLNNVSLFHEYDYELVGDDVIVRLHDPAEEKLEMRKQIDDLSQKLRENSMKSEKIEMLRKEYGDDGLLDIIGGILSDI